MIKLNRDRITISKELLDKSKRGVAELIEHFENKNSQIRPPFRPQIINRYKPFLLELSHNKCSFCESSIGTVSFGDVENFRPKSVYWWLAYDWNNLFAACQLCNQKFKRNLFPIDGQRAQFPENNLENEKALLINPAEENPEEFFIYKIDDSLQEVFIRPKDHFVERRASVTIETFGLNRKSLCKQRYKTIKSFTTLIGALNAKNQYNNKNLNDELEALISDRLDDSTPYAGALRYFYKYAVGIDSREDILKPILRSKFRASEEIKGTLKKDLKESTENYSQSSICYIKKITIKNYKCIEKVDFDLSSSIVSRRIFQYEDNEFVPPEIAKWTLILGGNGIGKSSILEAISIALIGEEASNKLFPVEKAKNCIRRGAKSCEIRLEFWDATISKLKILKTKGIKFSEGKEGKDILIKGYGHVRLVPPKDNELDQVAKFIDVGNLFNPFHSLCDVNKYFSELPEEPLKDVGISPFHFASQTLRDILPEIDETEIVKDMNGRIKLSISGREVFLDELSSGYQAVLILVSDIISSLKVEQLTDMQEQPGIILLDEIGSQLHPKWRMRIVKDLRKAFPRIQFIATTHEPLCLKGIATEEVVKMNKEETIQLNKIRHQDVSKLRVDQLLTSPLFGMDSTIDPWVEQKFKEYYELLKKEPEHSEKIHKLRGELSQYNTLGYTRRDQLLYDVIDTYIANNLDKIDIADIDDETKNKIIEAWNYANGRYQL